MPIPVRPEHKKGSLEQALVISAKSGIRGLLSYPGISPEEKLDIIREHIARGLGQDQCPLCGQHQEELAHRE